MCVEWINVFIDGDLTISQSNLIYYWILLVTAKLFLSLNKKCLALITTPSLVLALVLPSSKLLMPRNSGSTADSNPSIQQVSLSPTHKLMNKPQPWQWTPRLRVWDNHLPLVYLALPLDAEKARFPSPGIRGWDPHSEMRPLSMVMWEPWILSL